MAPPRPAAAGAIVLTAVGALFYALMLVALAGGPGGDPGFYGGESRIAQAYAELYALFGGVPLWVILGVLLIIAGRTGEMPRPAAILAGVLYPLAALAALAGANAGYDYPGGWSILVPALLPPAIALYALWARLPGFHRMLHPRTGHALGLGAIAAISLLTLPLIYLDDRQFPARAAAYQQRNEAIRVEREAEWARNEREKREEYARLTPESPFEQHLDYVTAVLPEAEHDKAIAGIRQVKTRQEDALRLLQAERPQLYSLRELWRFDLAATPALCTAFDAALRREAAADALNWNVGEYLEDQLPNIRFFTGAGCDLDGGVGAAADRVRLILAPMGLQDGGRPRWADFLATLEGLRRKP